MNSEIFKICKKLRKQGRYYNYGQKGHMATDDDAPCKNKKQAEIGIYDGSHSDTLQSR